MESAARDFVNNETTHLSIEIHQTTISIQHLKWDTISESLLHHLLNYMEQGIPLYTPFSKRSAAATALNKVLQHIASTHEPGTAVEIYPLTNNPYIVRLYPKVTKYQIHGLLLQLQCLKTWGGKVVFKNDIMHWNSCIDTANKEAIQWMVHLQVIEKFSSPQPLTDVEMKLLCNIRAEYKSTKNHWRLQEIMPRRMLGKGNHQKQLIMKYLLLPCRTLLQSLVQIVHQCLPISKIQNQ